MQVVPEPPEVDENGPAAERYAQQERSAESALERAAVDQLKAMDPKRLGTFSTDQVCELVRFLLDDHEANQPVRKRRRSWSGLCTCDCLVWLGLLVILCMAPVLIAAASMRELAAEASGVLRVAGRSVPAGAAAAAQLYNMPDLVSLPEAALRSVWSCAFPHRGVFHELRVASLVRSVNGDVRVVSPDRSVVLIRAAVADEGGVSVTVASSASYYRPFFGTEALNLTESVKDPSWRIGCTAGFSVPAGSRAQPIQ